MPAEQPEPGSSDPQASPAEPDSASPQKLDSKSRYQNPVRQAPGPGPSLGARGSDTRSKCTAAVEGPHANARPLEATFAAILLLAAVIVLFLPLSIRPPIGDVGIFVYMADRLVQGDRLYVDVWDNKPPLRPLLDQLAFMLFGRSPASLIYLLIVLSWLAALGLWRLGWQFGGRWGGWAAALVYLWASWGLEQACVQAEGLVAAPLAWAFVLALPKRPRRSSDATARTISHKRPGSAEACGTAAPGCADPISHKRPGSAEACGTAAPGCADPISHRRAVLAGALLACVAGIKTPFGAFVVPWVVLAGLSWPLVSAAVAFLVGVGLVVGYLAIQGVLSEAIYTLVVFPRYYVSVAQGGLAIFLDQIPHMAGGLWVALAGLTAGAVFTACAMSKTREMRGIFVAIVAAVALTVWQRYFWQHHWLPAYLFASVGFGGLAGWAARHGRGPKIALAAALFALCLPRPGYLLAEWRTYFDVVSGRLPRQEYAARFKTEFGDPPATYADLNELAADLRSRTEPQDYIWTFLLAPYVAYEAQRREATRFFYPDGVYTPAPRMEEWQREYVRNVIGRKPRFAIICRELRLPYQRPLDLLEHVKTDRELWRHFTAHYRLDRRVGGLEVYRFVER
jgi:hypothetical protein